jgi:hypothetical protein
MRAALEAHEADQHERRERHRLLRTPVQMEPTIDPNIKDQLRELGYLEAEDGS